MADISRVLPVSSLPHVETPQIERRGRGSRRRGGRGRLGEGESNDTLNEEVVGDEDKNMDFGKCSDFFQGLPSFLQIFTDGKKKFFTMIATFLCL